MLHVKASTKLRGTLVQARPYKRVLPSGELYKCESGITKAALGAAGRRRHSSPCFAGDARLTGSLITQAPPGEVTVPHDLVVALVTGVVGLVTAAVLALVNSAISARAGVDENLRQQRLTVYPALWNASAAFSRWPEQTVTRASLVALHERLRAWYYSEGGLFLSTAARARYGDVQELIAKLLEGHGSADEKLSPDRYTDLMNTASALRTALTEDLDTRRRPSLRERLRRHNRHRRFTSEARERIDVAARDPQTFEARS